MTAVSFIIIISHSRGTSLKLLQVLPVAKTAKPENIFEKIKIAFLSVRLFCSFKRATIMYRIAITSISGYGKKI